MIAVGKYKNIASIRPRSSVEYSPQCGAGFDMISSQNFFGFVYPANQTWMKFIFLPSSEFGEVFGGCRRAQRTGV